MNKGTHNISKQAINYWSDKLLASTFLPDSKLKAVQAINSTAKTPETQEESIKRQRRHKRIARFNQQPFYGYQNV